VKYAIIQCHFWDDERIWPLNPIAKLVFSYLLTNKHGNSIGFYVLRYGYGVSDVNITNAQFDEAFKELIQKGLIFWDRENSLLLIKNYLKHNPVYTDKQAAGAGGLLLSLPRSHLTKEFLRILEDPGIISCGNNHLLVDAVKRAIEKLDSEPAKPIPLAEEKKEAEESPRPPARPVPKREEIELVITHWNEICGEKLPRVQTLTERRQGFIRARLAEHSLQEWPGIFARVAKSGFLTGENDKNWRADFDWVMNQNNLVKILEGKYDDRRNVNRPKTGMDALKAVMEKSRAQQETVEVDPNAGTDVRPGDGPDPKDLQHQPG
jgi:hypothetical protein